MRVAIVCYDTRGGLQPYAALGAGLQQAGHEVRAAAPAEFAGMFTAAGLTFKPLSGPTGTGQQGATGVAERGTIAWDWD